MQRTEGVETPGTIWVRSVSKRHRARNIAIKFFDNVCRTSNKSGSTVNDGVCRVSTADIYGFPVDGECCRGKIS